MKSHELKESVRLRNIQRIALRGNKVRKNKNFKKTEVGRVEYVVDLSKDSEITILDGDDIKFVGEHILCSGKDEYDGYYCNSRPLGIAGFIQTFLQEGVFWFHCKKHPNEKLKVTVE